MVKEAASLSMPANTQLIAHPLSLLHQDSESYLYLHDDAGITPWLSCTPLDSNVTSATDQDRWATSYLDPQKLNSALEEVARDNDLEQLDDFFSRAIQECDQRVPRWKGLGRALQSYFTVICGVELSLEECVNERKKLWGNAVADRLWRHTGDEAFRTVYSLKDRE